MKKLLIILKGFFPERNVFAATQYEEIYHTGYEEEH